MIQTSESSRIYFGNNSNVTPYPVPFLFHNDDDLIVVVKDELGVEDTQLPGTDYTITGAGNPNGGNIVTTLPVSETSQVSIVRIVPMTQLTSYEEGDSFPAKSHEKALDKLTMEIQQLSRISGTGTGDEFDLGTAFRVTEASGALKALNKVRDSSLGVDTAGDAVLRTPTEMLSWLGQVGTAWGSDGERAQTRGAYAGQLGVQTSNWTIYVARSTQQGDWVPFLKQDGVVISENGGVPIAKNNPEGDIVGTTAAQILTNKTLNACAIHNPTGLTASDVGLGNVDNTSDEDKPVSVPIEERLQAKQDIAVKGFAQGYASLDSGGKVPIEQLPATVTGGNASFQTSWNAATNTPTIPPALPENNGFYYLVAVAGTTTIDGISSWAVGDQIISDGTAWKKITSTATVSSVAGKIGAVTLVKADVGLGNVDNTSVATQNSAVATLTNKTIKGSQNVLEVRLDADVINNLPVSKLNGGTGAGPNTWWNGTGAWTQPQGTGDTTSNTTSSVVGEAVVYADTDGKHIKGFSGTAGFAIFTPGNAVTTVPKIGPAETSPDFIHALAEKTTPVEDDEAVIWDSVTGQLMKVKKKNLGVPVATIVDWAGRPGNQADTSFSPPSGWLLCNGKQYPTATYPALFGEIGYGYGGSGANFNVPHLCGMVTVHRDYSEATSFTGRLTTHGAARYTVGGTFGNQVHTINYNEMPSHQHNTYFLGYHNAVTNGNYGLASINCGIPCGVGFNGSVMIYDGNARGGYIRYDAAGSNYSHNNTQPTFVVWKIIKY